MVTPTRFKHFIVRSLSAIGNVLVSITIKRDADLRDVARCGNFSANIVKCGN